MSKREQETLRLLLGGHDAKSIARNLGLSVHTVNERLREARRKLGVSSSREAARILAEFAPEAPPQFVADKQLGVPAAAAAVQHDPQVQQRTRPGVSLAWLGGGMLIMSLIIAAAVLSMMARNDAAQESPTTMTPANSTAGAAVPETAGSSAARGWAALLDNGSWDSAWDKAGTLFRSQVPRTNWPGIIRPVREPVGAAISRVLQSATKATSLPGAPPGEYEVVQFRTAFAHKPDAVETIALAHEGGAWKVDGYFIK